MPEQIIHTHELPNGLTVVIEPMSDVQSAAFCFLIPGGSAFDPASHGGTAAVLTDWIIRGAGDLDSRDLSNALDNLGVQRNESTGLNHLAFTAATLVKRPGRIVAVCRHHPAAATSRRRI